MTCSVLRHDPCKMSELTVFNSTLYPPYRSVRPGHTDTDFPADHHRLRSSRCITLVLPRVIRVNLLDDDDDESDGEERD